MNLCQITRFETASKKIKKPSKSLRFRKKVASQTKSILVGKTIGILGLNSSKILREVLIFRSKSLKFF